MNLNIINGEDGFRFEVKNTCEGKIGTIIANRVKNLLEFLFLSDI